MGEWGDKVDVNPMHSQLYPPSHGLYEFGYFLYRVAEANHLLYQIFVNFNTELDFFSVLHLFCMN